MTTAADLVTLAEEEHAAYAAGREAAIRLAGRGDLPENEQEALTDLERVCTEAVHTAAHGLSLAKEHDKVGDDEYDALVARIEALNPGAAVVAILKSDPATNVAHVAMLETEYEEPVDWGDYYAQKRELDRDAVRRPTDWAEFWTKDFHDDEWLCEPLLARGRSHALYASAKAGKSLLMLEVAAALATGRSTLRQAAGTPRNVVYLDEEMTEADLQERLVDMGYGPDDDLSHLHYFTLPCLPPLDTEAGGREVRRIADEYDAEIVVIDTMCRVITGDENSADTMKAFARFTGQPLKAAGRTVIRLDHAGKNQEQGQRGSSAKNDDVDVVWSLKATEDGVKLEATHRRISWVPESIDLTRTENPLRHRPAVASYVTGTKTLAEMLDRWDVPLNLGRGKVRSEYLEPREMKFSNKAITDALRWRRERAVEAENLSRTGAPSPTLKAVPDSREAVA